MGTMRRLVKGAAVVALALGTGVAGGVAVQAQAGGGDGGNGRVGQPRGAAVPSRTTELTPITPCRIFSSAAAGGKLAPGETRSVDKGGDLSGQGGNAAGCGIPAAATGLEVSVSATLNEGPGYVRVWPEAVSEPGATFLNYTAAGAATNAGAVQVDTGNDDVMDVKNYGSRTHIIIDVLGYYIRPTWAVVTAEGTLVHGSRVSSVTRDSAGWYYVDFDVNTDSCAKVISIGRYGSTVSELYGYGTAQTSNTFPNRVYVRTFSDEGVATDLPFSLAVSC
jgi:hypothetical protein